MKPINELDLAALRHEFRGMYKTAGYVGALRCLYEILKAGEILSEVILEERRKENNERMA